MPRFAHLRLGLHPARHPALAPVLAVPSARVAHEGRPTTCHHPPHHALCVRRENLGSASNTAAPREPPVCLAAAARPHAVELLALARRRLRFAPTRHPIEHARVASVARPHAGGGDAP
jgi:hypothetical protein